MSKGTLVFNLPEEQEEFDCAAKAGETASNLHEFDQWLRSIVKYDAEKDLNLDVITVQRIRDRLWELMGKALDI